MSQTGAPQRPRKLGRGLADVAHVFLSASEQKKSELVEQPEFWLIKNKILSITAGEGVRGKTLLAFLLSMRLGSLGRSVALVSPHYEMLTALVEQTTNLAGGLGEGTAFDRACIYRFGGIFPQDTSPNNPEWLEVACRQAEFVVVDTPPQNELSTQVWRLSNLVLVLTQPGTRQMQSSYAAIKSIVTVNRICRVGLVVNMARGHDEGERCFRKMAGATRSYIKVNLRNYGYIPFEERLLNFWENAEMLLDLESCEASKRVEQVAKSILMDEAAIAKRGKEVTLRLCV